MTPQIRDALLNEFAFRSFRDVADGDYIAARMAFRAGLFIQALWASQQALEKYIKAVLLLRRIRWLKGRHDLVQPLRLLEQTFPLKLSQETRGFLKTIDHWQADRYLTYSYHATSLQLISLDRAVWELRRYCIPYNTGTTPKGRPFEAHDIAHIEDAENHPPQAYHPLSRGFLDRILENRKSELRAALIWKNFYFGLKPRHSIPNFRHTLHSANSVIAQHPEILAELKLYVYLPNDVKNWKP